MKAWFTLLVAAAATLVLGDVCPETQFKRDDEELDASELSLVDPDQPLTENDIKVNNPIFLAYLECIDLDTPKRRYYKYHVHAHSFAFEETTYIDNATVATATCDREIVNGYFASMYMSITSMTSNDTRNVDDAKDDTRYITPFVKIGEDFGQGAKNATSEDGAPLLPREVGGRVSSGAHPRALQSNPDLFKRTYGGFRFTGNPSGVADRYCTAAGQNACMSSCKSSKMISTVALVSGIHWRTVWTHHDCTMKYSDNYWSVLGVFHKNRWYDNFITRANGNRWSLYSSAMSSYKPNAFYEHFEHWYWCN